MCLGLVLSVVGPRLSASLAVEREASEECHDRECYAYGCRCPAQFHGVEEHRGECRCRGDGYRDSCLCDRFHMLLIMGFGSVCLAARYVKVEGYLRQLPVAFGRLGEGHQLVLDPEPFVAAGALCLFYELEVVVCHLLRDFEGVASE